jgi:hypothetical protein
MPMYTVHVGPFASARADGEDVVFLPETFSRAAFFLGPLWLVWARAWLGLGIWLATVAVIVAAVIWLRLAPPAAFALLLIGQALLGLEANYLRGLSLERRGYRFADVVSGERMEDAERGFFRRATIGASFNGAPRAVVPSPNAYREVGGLFSDADG